MKRQETGGWLLAAWMTVLSVGTAAPVFTGDTSNPANSCFAQAARAEAVFSAAGYTPKSRQRLDVKIFDEEDACVMTPASEDVTIAADGTWTGRVTLPTARLGFFRVRATLGGVTLPKTGSRPAGCLTYHVAPDPATRPLYGEHDHFLGVHGAPGGAPYYLHWIGARWGLRGIGPYETREAYEKARARMTEQGWTYYGIYSPQATHLRYDIAWLTEKERAWFNAQGKDAWNLFFTPEGRAIYRKILERNVRLSLEQPFFNRDRVWEIMWEPELTVPSPERLLEAVRFSHGIVKGIDPAAKIALPTLSGFSHMDFYKRIFELGILRYADVFDMHFYSALPPEENGYVRNVRNLIKMVRAYAGRDLPMIATEGGYSAKAVQADEWKQMAGLIRMLLILKGEGFDMALPFYGSDYGGDYADRAEGDYGITYNLQLPKVRFGPKNVSPRPVFSALSGFAHMVDCARPTACLDYLGDTAMGYAFQDPAGEVTLALWCWGAEPTKVEIPTGVPTVRVGDIMGNVKTVSLSDGVFRATLSGKPVYVKGVSKSLWGREAVPTVRTAQKAFSMVAGGICRIDGTAERPVELEVRPSAALGVEPFVRTCGKGAFSVTFPLPDLLPDGTYPVMLAARENGKIVSMAGVSVNVEAPVRIRTVSRTFDDGAPGLGVTLENMTDTVRTGVLEMRVTGVPEARNQMEVTMAPRTVRRVRLVCGTWRPDPFRMFPCTVSFTAANGYRTVCEKQVNFLSAAHVPGAGENSDFSAWKEPAWCVPPRRIKRKPEYTADARDLAVKMAAGWNEKYFLMAFEVTDDEACPPARGDWWSWRGDAVQVAFAKNVLEKPTDNAWADALDQAMTENTVALTPDGPMMTRTVSYDPQRFPCDLNGPACRVSDAPVEVTKTTLPDGRVRYLYRLAFPWKYMNRQTAKAGETVYFAAAVNDLDRDQPDLSALSVFEMKELAPRGFGAAYLAE